MVKNFSKTIILISQRNNQVFTALLNQKNYPSWKKNRLPPSYKKQDVFQLSDLFVENLDRPSLVGSIYRARVIKKHVGLGAYFMDLGEEQCAFLYEKPVRENPTLLIEEGQKQMVQVCKDRLGGKNPRVTTRISLPGRYLVYLPTTSSYVGVSRQVAELSKREKLKEIVKQWSGEDSFIIRTLGAEVKQEVLKKELKKLKNQWKDIQSVYNKQNTEGMIWEDECLQHQVIRDFLTKETIEVGVDSGELFKNVKKFLSSQIPEFKGKIKLYEDTDLFSVYYLEKYLASLLEKKVRLKSGGFLIIEETSGGIIIDVNTGKSRGKNIERYLLKTNLEAAHEIARQLRLRNCGGIILIDFIDMKQHEFCENVVNILLKELKKDRSYTYVLPMSELGVVQMTRKRKRPSLIETICEPCPHCHGRSYVKIHK